MPPSTPNTRQGSALRGILGAFLGGFLAFFLWSCLFAVAPKFLQKILLLGCILVGVASCLGYWLFRGWRGSKKARYFAYFATQICAVLAVPAAMFGIVAVTVDVSRADWLDALLLRWKQLLNAEYLLFVAAFAILALMGARMGQRLLLRYTDPAWVNDPRRIAAMNAGGALYNYWPEALPVKLELPKRFWVGGKLEISGESIRTIPTFGAGQTFSVYDVAGVLIGPSNGSNVLYDYQNRVMAKFAWSMDHSNLLVQYLKEYGVPFAPYHPKSKNGAWMVDSAAPGAEEKSPRS